MLFLVPLGLITFRMCHEFGAFLLINCGITLFYLFEVINPFFIAFIIAYLTNPLKIRLDKYMNKTFRERCFNKIQDG